jgi:hypothetical protein
MSDDYRLEVQNARHAHTATEVTLAGVVARLELGELGAASAELALTKQHEVEEAVAFLHQFADHSLNFLRRPATDLTEWRYFGNLDHGEIVTLIDSVLLDRQRNRDQAFEERMQAQQQAHERELRERNAEHGTQLQTQAEAHATNIAKVASRGNWFNLGSAIITALAMLIIWWLTYQFGPHKDEREASREAASRPVQ